MPPTFPASDLDTPETVQALLGSFWAGTYDGVGQVRNYVMAVCQAYRQTAMDLDEATQSITWRNVPLRHVVEWYPITVLASERLNASLTGLRFSESTTATFGYGGAFGQPLPGAVQPAALGDVIDAPLLCDQITTPNACLIRDVDYTINSQVGAIQFAADPFKDPRFTPQPIFDANGNQTDSELILWLYRAEFDLKNLQTQIGYALGLDVPSTEAAQALVTALLDALQAGTARQQVQSLLEAICGVQFAQNDSEVVQAVTRDYRGLLIVTDQNAYRFPLGANALVTIGQVVEAGDALADTVQLLDLSSGAIPAGLNALIVGPVLLGPGYTADLVFGNSDVSLVATTDAGTNKTKVSCQLGGTSVDQAQFWTDVHARGVAAGKTLAELLDTRANPVGQPTAADLPATLNPLKLLIESVFRYNCLLAKINSAGIDPSGLGLSALRYLRRITPPHELVITLVDLTTTTDHFTITGTEVVNGATIGASGLVDPSTVTIPGQVPIKAVSQVQ